MKEPKKEATKEESTSEMGKRCCLFRPLGGRVERTPGTAASGWGPAAQVGHDPRACPGPQCPPCPGSRGLWDLRDWGSVQVACSYSACSVMSGVRTQQRFLPGLTGLGHPECPHEIAQELPQERLSYIPRYYLHRYATATKEDRGGPKEDQWQDAATERGTRGARG